MVRAQNRPRHRPAGQRQALNPARVRPPVTICHGRNVPTPEKSSANDTPGAPENSHLPWQTGLDGHQIRHRHSAHLIRNTFRLASKRDWDALKRDIKPVYTAVSPAAARDAMNQGVETWGSRYGAIIRLWENAWEQFIPFLDYDVEIRTVPGPPDSDRNRLDAAVFAI